MSVQDVAASLHVSTREVIRMAEQGILPALRVKGGWRFRAGEVWNWTEANLHSLPKRRAKDKHPPEPGDLLISTWLKEPAVVVNLAANTKTSVLRELVRLAVKVDETLEGAHLIAALAAREAKGPTAIQDGVALPHPAAPVYSQGPVLAAARTVRGLAFGEPRGGLTDLFFLVCCPNQVDHLLFLGRMCRLLIEKKLQAALRQADDSRAFIEAIWRFERELCSRPEDAAHRKSQRIGRSARSHEP